MASLPSLDLKMANLRCGTNMLVWNVMLHSRTRDLTPDWAGSSSSLPDAYPRCFSKYITSFRGHLRSLRLQHASKTQIGESYYYSYYDHLALSTLVHFNIHNCDVAVDPPLQQLLARIARHSRLESLTLGVSTSVYHPLDRFAELLAMYAPHFATFQEIQFIVDGCLEYFDGSAPRAREHFEPVLLAVIPGRPNRRIFCVDGEDPEDDL
ncbi:hypothetical protein B0H16DRAFT_1836025 [Mycena metata]|uniref:Uncharacterized protein n=1 Tax=Mycena metata TaxID=1033252 RepID=A0AAD7NAT4_9AGAR|nr:hypothetical protein B0H16DRAFT_1836025 [Mycena metata]